MHEAGVAADDRLDRDQARQVFRRSLAMLGGHRAQLIAAASLMVLWTLTTLAGPLLIRYGIDQGIVEADRNALRNAAIGYAVIVVVGYLAFRAQVLAVAKIGEQFLYELRLRAFAHLQRLSMSFYDREKAGVLVSRLTSDIDAVAELLQMGLLMLVTNSLLLVLAVVVLGLVSWQLLLVCLLALPGVVVCQPQVPAGLQRALPRGPGSHRLDAGPAPGGHLRCAGRAGARGRGPGDGAVRRGQRKAVPGPPRLGLGAGLVPQRDRAVLPRHDGGRRAGRRSDGGGGGRHHRNGRVLHPDPVQPVRAGPAAEPALQHAPVGRGRSAQGVRPAGRGGRTRRAARSRRPPGQRRSGAGRRALRLRRWPHRGGRRGPGDPRG